MVSPELEARILRLYHVEKWSFGRIARELGVHHSVARRVLAESGVGAALEMTRPSIIDPYKGFILETLQKHPRLPASRLYGMVRERGYTGGADHFRHFVARCRPKPAAEAFLRLQVLPGEQAQVDWGHFGKLRIGQAQRHLSAFVIVLSWSRAIFVRFYLSQSLENFMRGHEAAFETFGGVPRVCLYDNLKAVVIERVGDAVRFNTSFLAFAGHYRYEPRPVGVRRANEKGRVERAIRYVRDSFFVARKLKDLDTLNAEAAQWCHELAATRRCPADSTLSVAEAYQQERKRLIALPDTRHPTDERVVVQARKSPYVRFDLNDYSIPHKRTRRPLTVVASHTELRILDGEEVVARHPRTYGKGTTVEDPEHVQSLVEFKRAGRRDRAIDRLQRAAPSSTDLLSDLAERGHNLGSVTQALTALLDQFGASELEQALIEVIEKGSPFTHSVRHVLERRQRERGIKPQAVSIRFEHARDITVEPHSLDSYDELGNNGQNQQSKESEDEPNDDN